MLPEVKRKLDNLDVTGWDEVLIEHENEGHKTIGIHTVYSWHEDDDENIKGVSWSHDPIVVADDLQSLKQALLDMCKLIDERLITTESELIDYNTNFTNNQNL